MDNPGGFSRETYNVVLKANQAEVALPELFRLDVRQAAGGTG